MRCLPEGLKVRGHWGFKYKSNLIWYKIRKDGGPDRRGVGFYFAICHGGPVVWRAGQNERAERCQPGAITREHSWTQKREHAASCEQYDLIEQCRFWQSLWEIFARGPRDGWTVGGPNLKNITPTWDTYSNISQSKVVHFEKGVLLDQ